jgi:hypothetical protein
MSNVGGKAQDDTGAPQLTRSIRQNLRSDRAGWAVNAWVRTTASIEL